MIEGCLNFTVSLSLFKFSIPSHTLGHRNKTMYAFDETSLRYVFSPCFMSMTDFHELVE